MDEFLEHLIKELTSWIPSTCAQIRAIPKLMDSFCLRAFCGQFGHKTTCWKCGSLTMGFSVKNLLISSGIAIIGSINSSG